MASRRRPSPTTALVLVLLCLYYAPRWAYALSFNLNFSDHSAFSSIITTGDASISAPTIELTRNARQFPDIRNSVGRATFAHKVRLWSSATGEMASFTTNFSFQITPAPAAYNIPFPYGDGMAFFLGHFPTAIPQNSSGRNLGLLTDFTTGTGDGRIVAIEFNTYSNPKDDDINGNHVGIDVNSLYSMASTDTTTSLGKNLSSSIVMEARVTYHNDTKMLAVDLLIGDALYQVNATVDLWCALPDRSERPSVVQAMNVLQSEEAKLPELSPYMYMAVRTDPASSGRHGAFSSDCAGPGFVRSSSGNTGDTNLSPDLSSTASVRRSRFPTV